MKPILEKYYKNRNDIEPGDIILTQGSSLLSKSIQYFDRLSGENEIYNHALLVGYMHGKLIAIESVAKGVHPEFLSYRLSKNVNFCVLKSTGFSTELKENAITKLLTTAESTIKYDNLLLLRIAAYRKFGIDLEKLGSNNLDVCSETTGVRFATKLLEATSFKDIIEKQGWITPEDHKRYYNENEFTLILDDFKINK